MSDEKMIVMTADVEDGGWTCVIPKLPGCVAHGSTKAEALVDLRRAIEAWIKAGYQAERLTYKDLMVALSAALSIPTIDVSEPADG